MFTLLHYNYAFVHSLQRELHLSKTPPALYYIHTYLLLYTICCLIVMQHFAQALPAPVITGSNSIP